MDLILNDSDIPKCTNQKYCHLIRKDYEIYAYDPFLIFVAKANICSLKTEKIKRTFKSDPWNILKTIFNNYKKEYARFANIGFEIGSILALGYGLGDYSYKNIKAKSGYDNKNIPDLIAFFPSKYFVINKKSGNNQMISLLVNEVIREAHAKNTDLKNSTQKKNTIYSNFTKEKYCKAVKSVRGFIKKGDVYQTNIAQTFSGCSNKKWEDIFDLFKNNSETPYSTLINMRDYQIMTCSPERFLKRSGDTIISQPIKGTSPRKKYKNLDNISYNNLISSQKEEAELAMIVDLVRNDLSISSLPGTVKVEEFKKVESFPNVHHLVATVSAKVKSSYNSIDIIRNAFPPASVTGCPKIRAMEIIAEIERAKRGFYCGAIGSYGYNGDFDLSMAIRTALTVPLKKCIKFYYSAGSGIVLDSTPKNEYKETLHKAKPFLEAIQE
ncbi:MAG: anthranilate synthase component I family protein [Elusimicrobiota bacterium]